MPGLRVSFFTAVPLSAFALWVTMSACGSSPSTNAGPDANIPDAVGLVDGGPRRGDDATSDASTPGSGDVEAGPDGTSSAVDAAKSDSTSPPQDSGGETSAPRDAANGGGDAGSCPGSVTFRVLAASGSPYCANLQCEFADLVQVKNSSGQSLTTARETNGCFVVECAICSGGGCSGACPQAAPLADGGVEIVWDGTVWTPGGMCGAAYSCSTAGCAPAGQYTAHMCAYPLRADAGGGCNGNGPSAVRNCVDVPFTYPAQAAVVGTLP